MSHITTRQAAIGAFVWLLLIGGGIARATAPSATPADPCHVASTGHMTFNPCATLDTTQVQDRRPQEPTTGADWTADTASDWPLASDGMYACTEEDGSAPGQPFPCRWDATQGNGQGNTYTLDGPM